MEKYKKLLSMKVQKRSNLPQTDPRKLTHAPKSHNYIFMRYTPKLEAFSI